MGDMGHCRSILHRHAVRVSGGQYNKKDMYAADSSGKRLPRRKRLAMTEKAPLLVIAMKSFVGWGHVPTGAGTTKYVQTCSFQPSAASRSAGTCPRPTKAVSFIMVRFFACGLRGAQRRGNLFVYAHATPKFIRTSVGGDMSP